MKNPKWLRENLERVITLFEKFGLQTNEMKTNFIILRGAAAPKALSTSIYDKGGVKTRGLKGGGLLRNEGERRWR